MALYSSVYIKIISIVFHTLSYMSRILLSYWHNKVKYFSLLFLSLVLLECLISIAFSHRFTFLPVFLIHCQRKLLATKLQSFFRMTLLIQKSILHLKKSVVLQIVLNSIPALYKN